MLTRKVRKVGTSLVVTLPSQACKAFNIEEGDEVKIEINNERLIVEKVGGNHGSVV